MLAVSAVVCDAIPDAITLQELVEATNKDPKQAVHKGHCDINAQPLIKEYAKHFDTLSVIDGAVCKMDKLCRNVS